MSGVNGFMDYKMNNIKFRSKITDCEAITYEILTEHFSPSLDKMYVFGK